jgi:hypothetical protein
MADLPVSLGQCDFDMSNQREEAARSALEATQSFIRVLRKEGMTGWAERFEKIVASIEEGRLAETVHLFSLTQYSGPGSLSDAYTKDEPAYYAAWGACSKSLSALKRLSG